MSGVAQGQLIHGIDLGVDRRENETESILRR